MTKIISLFNNKGGVSKTTTTFHLSWMLAEKGYKVLMIDTDPQCNLTGLCLSLAGSSDIEDFYEHSGTDNIKDALDPAFSGIPRELSPAKCFEFPNRENLYLLPGHIDFSQFDVTMGIAQELTGSMRLSSNIPGAIHHLIKITAEEYGFDYVIIDMSPSVTATNANLLMQSDFFLVPCSPDYFCNMAINSLVNIIPLWKRIYDRLQTNEVFQHVEYEMPSTRPLFIGTIMQRYRPKNGSPARSFQSWIDRINENVSNHLAPTLQSCGMMVDAQVLRRMSDNGIPFNLINISDFNGLIAQSQKYNVPVFSLSDEQIEQTGVVLTVSRRNKEEFHHVFDRLAEKVINVTA
jgi:cellulose biosynthesis protein BcsQ